MVTTRALSKLAASGEADAQFRLGYRFAFCKDKRRRNLKRTFHRDGDGVKASNQKAREWLQKAARRRHAPAREALTGML
jgi:TPR repeat protein